MRSVGDELWSRFSADRESVIGHYDALATEFTKLERRPDGRRARERAVADIRQFVAA